MTIKQAKEYLREARRLYKVVEIKKTRLRYLRDTLDCFGGTPSAIKVKESPTIDRVGNSVARLVDLEMSCKEDLMLMLDLQEEIEGQINRMGRYGLQIILYERYINNKKWQTIAHEAGYSEGYTKELHKKAVKLFAETAKE
ncbi:MAG: hypothetical protein FWG63_03960 [Defluviitaleaceae bacterium]|nr:hypothetical protein [Defluviitaleaceae bacterium]